MFRFWATPLALLAALAAGALVLWALAGPVAALAAATALLLALVLGHWRRLYALRRWLDDPQPDALPPGAGTWEEPLAALRRLLRERQRSESSLSRAIVRFRQAASAMPDGVVMLDEADAIVWCNPRAATYLGIDLARDTGQQITYLLRQPAFAAYLAAQNFSEPLLLRLPGAVAAALEVQLVPYEESRKLMIVRDVTHVERAETVRRDFVANVSHELRTPLTVLVGFLETLAGMTRLDGETPRRTLRLMSDQAGRMQRLVEDLLTLSRLEGAHNPLVEAPVDVPRLIGQVCDDARAMSGGAHAIELDLAVADWLVGSEEELRSACGNLVSNAVRYTPAGGTVKVAWRRDGDALVFSVQDTGVGIEPQHIPRLTERFYRVDRSRSRDTGGTGLGLAIVKHALLRHQARLEIASEPGRGSVFSAVFPPQRRAEPGAAQP